MSDGIRLHIGGQQKHDGWVILDANPGPIVDFVGNCTDLTMFSDDSCSDVYASHVFEHLGYNGEVIDVLKSCYRILKPGGRIRISVPDLETLCRLYVHPQGTFDTRLAIMRMIYGGRIDAYDIHYAGFDAELLGSYLHTAGFKNIERVKSFGLFKDTSEMLFGGVPISLNISALK